MFSTLKQTCQYKIHRPTAT